MFKKNKKDEVLKKLSNRFLFGINYSEDYLELITYDKESKKIENDFFDINLDEELLELLNKRRRCDCIDCYRDIYNDVNIKQVDEDNIAIMEFLKKDNRFIVNYNISTNLLREKEETDFIFKFVDLYSFDRSVMNIENKIIDINEYKKGNDVPLGCDILLTDKNNYGKELHLFGKIICKEIVPGLKEMKDIQRERKI